MKSFQQFLEGKEVKSSRVQCMTSMVNALKNNLNEKKKLYSEYYKIKQEYFNYKGERYFKHSYNADSILQVCFATKSNIKKITQI